ncbi:hypothetical protein SAMN05444410_10392 [Hydrobacter penzbergensis]|jgi:hypothetical protein|uniref:Uncharacterized protein n=1 Tax=Hydrobacter penzbergensis TaxID=1235997 RepID=A0A8X8IEP0_9BACT|nr:hypothetical protein CLV53_10292 [Sediminibacterium magnilacihabitans]SDW48576.1 hypothetical protein SAMN05444410_10392 [Hydrobacter penzbergensis]
MAGQTYAPIVEKCKKSLCAAAFAKRNKSSQFYLLFFNNSLMDARCDNNTTGTTQAGSQI